MGRVTWYVSLLQRVIQRVCEFFPTAAFSLILPMQVKPFGYGRTGASRMCYTRVLVSPHQKKSLKGLKIRQPGAERSVAPGIRLFFSCPEWVQQNLGNVLFWFNPCRGWTGECLFPWWRFALPWTAVCTSPSGFSRTNIWASQYRPSGNTFKMYPRTTKGRNFLATYGLSPDGVPDRR